MNKYYNKDSAPSTQSGGEGGSNAAQGNRATLSMPIKTANWPGLPGKGGPDRSAGVPKHGYVGDFYPVQEFSPRKTSKPMYEESGEMMMKKGRK